MNEPLRHHCVPRFLLRNFATPQEDAGRLYGFDRQNRKSFPTSPSNAAVIREFYSVEDRVNPDAQAVEKFFAHCEATVAPSIQTLIQSRRIATKWDYDSLIFLAALQAQRSPRARKQVEGAWLARILGQVAVYTTSKASRRRWRDRMTKTGLAGDALTPEGFISRLTSGDFTVRSDHECWKIALLLDQGLPLLVQRLQQRRWNVKIIPPTVEPLAISDSAAVLDPWGPPHECRQGWGSTGADVLFPLTPRMLLVGTFAPERRKTILAQEIVAQTNAVSLAWADRFVYATDQDFIFQHTPGKFTTWSHAVANSAPFPSLIDPSYTMRLMTSRDLASD